MQICNIEKSDANARATRRLEQNFAHLVRVVVLTPVLLMMNVMKFADGRDASECHLRKCCRRQRQIIFGGQSIGDLIHQSSPRPEVAETCPAVCATTQSTMKRVAMCIDKTRHGDAGDTHIFCVRLRVGLDRHEHRVFDSDSHVCRATFAT